jgi:hypothetical protein
MGEKMTKAFSDLKIMCQCATLVCKIANVEPQFKDYNAIFLASLKLQEKIKDAGYGDFAEEELELD